MTWLGRMRRHTRREQLAAALVVTGLVLFTLAVYSVVVLGGGALLGRSSPGPVLSVVATAVVALALDPVQARLETTATRVAHGRTPAPYDVLRRFSGTVTGRFPAEELPVRMARVLAEGTGARWAQVWLVVGQRPVLAATWPPGAGDEAGGSDAARDEAGDGHAPAGHDRPGRRVLAVRYDDEQLGRLVVQERAGVALTSVEERLFAGLADQAGPVLRGARLRAELGRRAGELTVRAEELRASRQRLVDVQDEQRRLLERDIHDGAQQHLVALAVNLRLARTLAERSPDRTGALLAAQAPAADDAIATVVQLARGIYPPLLADRGLVASVRAVTGAGPVPVAVVDRAVGRYAFHVEAAAYFACLEALQNAGKHAGASRITVTLVEEAGELAVTVDDDGIGLDPLAVSGGTGLTNMRARVESVGGTLSMGPGPGRGTRVRFRLPATPPAPTGSVTAAPPAGSSTHALAGQGG